MYPLTADNVCYHLCIHVYIIYKDKEATWTMHGLLLAGPVGCG